jgi:hypothetical protein
VCSLEPSPHLLGLPKRPTQADSLQRRLSDKQLPDEFYDRLGASSASIGGFATWNSHSRGPSS